MATEPEEAEIIGPSASTLLRGIVRGSRELLQDEFFKPFVSTKQE
jgi:hypothetical protein